MAITISGSGTMGTMASGGITGGATITAGTAQASTSGTSIDFTGIPSWVKRVTVMFNGVSTNGSSNYLIQIGAGSVTSSGYTSAGVYITTSNSNITSSTAGFVIFNATGSAASNSGSIILTLLSSNTWTASGNLWAGATYILSNAGVSPALSGALDRVRITTVNGTDTFDAGSINILYE